MLEKVVAVATAAGGLVLAGAGLAVADVQTAAPSSHNVAGGASVSAIHPCVNAHGEHSHSIPKAPRAPEAPKGPVQPGHPQDHQQPGHPNHPHKPGNPHEPQDEQGPGPSKYRHGPQYREHGQKSHGAPEELAETGSQETGWTLVTGAGLLLSGAVLYRRARVARR